MNEEVSTLEKRSLKLIIAILPPAAKKTLEPIKKRLETAEQFKTLEFDNMVGTVHDWVYENILKEAFKIKPRYGSDGSAL